MTRSPSSTQVTARLEKLRLHAPPSRGPRAKIDHVVVLFMENRAFDHQLGCLANDIPGVDGIPASGHSVPADAAKLDHGRINITCGK